MQIEHRKRIGNTIRAMREKKKLSVRQLAEMSGVIYSNVSKIENGRYNVSVDILGKIADALGVELTMIEKEAE